MVKITKKIKFLITVVLVGLAGLFASVIHKEKEYLIQKFSPSHNFGVNNANADIPVGFGGVGGGDGGSDGGGS